MYERIRQPPPVRQRYAEQLAREGVVPAAAAAAAAEQTYQRLADIQQSLKANLREAGVGQEPQRISGAQAAVVEPDTAVSPAGLPTLNEQLLVPPAGVSILPQVPEQPGARPSPLPPHGDR